MDSAAEVDLSATLDGIAGDYSVGGVHYVLDPASGDDWNFVGTTSDVVYASRTRRN